MYSYDPNKPVFRTRDGRPLRLICLDRQAHSANPQKRLVALVKESDGTETPRTYFANGRFLEDREDDLDLANRQEVEHTIFICQHRKTGGVRVFDKDPSEGAKGSRSYEILERRDITFECDL